MKHDPRVVVQYDHNVYAAKYSMHVLARLASTVATHGNTILTVVQNFDPRCSAASAVPQATGGSGPATYPPFGSSWSRSDSSEVDLTTTGPLRPGAGAPPRLSLWEIRKSNTKYIENIWNIQFSRKTLNNI